MQIILGLFGFLFIFITGIVVGVYICAETLLKTKNKDIRKQYLDAWDIK